MKVLCFILFASLVHADIGIAGISAVCNGTIENNTDFKGYDVSSVTDVESADDCCALCASDPGCSHWTLWVSGKTCYKKKSDKGRRSLDDHISGTAGPPGGCTSDLDCSLNGICKSSKCVCDRPWKGEKCGQLGYTLTPAVGKNVRSTGDWGAPVIGPVNGNYHMYLEISNKLLNCITPNIEGPWNCTTEIKGMGKANPAAIIYKDPDTGKTMYLLWIAGQVPAVSDSPWGPFKQIPDSNPPDTSNPTVVFHDGAFYYTTQHAQTLWTTPKLDQPWTVHGNINFKNVGTREDSFLWVDTRGNFHLIGHAYDTSQKTNCGNSTVSDHGFSPDGKTWYNIIPLDPIGPYRHKVEYDDGTSQIYSTMERPALYFNADGQPTHLINGAEFASGDKGCAPTPCVNCKYDWSGTRTIITKLDV